MTMGRSSDFLYSIAQNQQRARYESNAQFTAGFANKHVSWHADSNHIMVLVTKVEAAALPPDIIISSCETNGKSQVVYTHNRQYDEDDCGCNSETNKPRPLKNIQYKIL